MCTAANYKVRHVYHSPLLMKRKKKNSPKKDERYPRFQQMIENKWVGDDGPVAPPLNIHVEVTSRLG